MNALGQIFVQNPEICVIFLYILHLQLFYSGVWLVWCIFNQEISDFHLSTQGTVEAGSTKTVAISFHPPQSAVKDGIIIQANTNIILKGDATRTCKLLLRAITAH
jgi:hypothetical protein